MSRITETNPATVFLPIAFLRHIAIAKNASMNDKVMPEVQARRRAAVVPWVDRRLSV
jgi:hypothetical protein